MFSYYKDFNAECVAESFGSNHTAQLGDLGAPECIPAGGTVGWGQGCGRYGDARQWARQLYVVRDIPGDSVQEGQAEIIRQFQEVPGGAVEQRRARRAAAGLCVTCGARRASAQVRAEAEAFTAGVLQGLMLVRTFRLPGPGVSIDAVLVRAINDWRAMYPQAEPARRARLWGS